MYSAGSEKFNVVSVELSRILAIKVRASPVVPLRIAQKELWVAESCLRFSSDCDMVDEYNARRSGTKTAIHYTISGTVSQRI